MALGVKLEPVANLLDKEFFIRSYQRGYRWDEDQINDLMNDFKEFIDDGNKLEEEFYCLQPIVVKLLTSVEKEKLSKFKLKSDEIYEVIDGQQRITSIAILLHYLSEVLKEKIQITTFPTITYEVRTESKEILSNFNSYILSDEKREALDDNIDFYHMQIVYKTINEWFKTNGAYELSFLKLLTSYKINCVKVIWYQVAESENSIKVFRRFNVGKIPLTNAELIKALFLKEDSSTSQAVKYSISKEWQNIENKLQSDFFWGFLNPKEKYTSRIEYIFELLFKSDRNALKPAEKDFFDKKYGSDENKVFRYFSALIEKENNLLQVWDKVNDVFEKFVQWFNDSEHYHYIGYLQNREGNNKSDNFILDLLTYKNPEKLSFQTKQELTNYLIDTIAKNDIKWFKDKKIILNYGSNKMDLRNFFFLFHVETCVKLSLASKGEEIYKLPFKLNKANNYDIEHIDSKTDKDIDKLKEDELIVLLKDLQIDFEFEIGKHFQEIIAPIFKDKESTDLWHKENLNYTELQKGVTKVLETIEDLFSNETDQLKDRNVIGNLTILNDSINRSYGNSFFSTKRRLIIEFDKNGEHYIPLSTKNVFFKYYSGNIKKHTRWNQTDADNYQLELESKLLKFAI